MAKKNFKGDNPAMAFITNPDVQETQAVQEKQGVQDTLNAHDVQQKQKALGTQGRKGQKLPRINMAFSEINLEYLQLMSRIEGLSMTAYVNRLIESDREKNTEVIERAKEILSGAKK